MSRSEVGVTVSVPGAGGGGALVLLAGVLVDGAGELGFGLALDGGAEVGDDGCPLLAREPGLVDDAPVGGALPPPGLPPPGLPPPADGAPPAPGVGETCAAGFTDTVGCGWLPGPGLLGPPPAEMLVPWPGPGPRAAALPP
ncbi:MAG TPA: hypothetical protein VJ347_24395, partial [Streptosporangiaceae bacterium]|nr:hypothetical protein [Streptosporangiaceae bacterium]